VLIPVRDGERFIVDAVDSALGQTYANVEVVVVDDGSRDRTRAIVESRAATDRRLRVISQPNQGVAAARNRGLAEARGEFIAPLDADDVWDPTKIERQVGRMIEAGDGTGLVYCWWLWIDETGAVLDCSPEWRIEGRAAEILLQVNYTGSASVPLFRRRDLERVGGYDVTMRRRVADTCEDWDVALKIAETSRVAVVPSPLVAYRRRRDSLSSRTDLMWRAHALVMEAARQRRPELSQALIRRSQAQFALYLAGVSFWSGTYLKAVRWGLRASPSIVTVRALPYVIRVLSTRLIGRSAPRESFVRPGVPFADLDMPRALIPYDVLYDRPPTHKQKP
jgi:glycosyltransferase involved in cell wall biosynthesis